MNRFKFLSAGIMVWMILGLWAYNVTLVGFGVGMIWLAFFTLCLYISVIYALFGRISIYDLSGIKNVREKLIILATVCVVFFPVLTEGFFYHDDWINFVNGFYNVTIQQRREITGLLTDMMSFVTVENSYWLRIFAVIGMIIYAEIIFEILQDKVSNFTALIISLGTTFLWPTVNVVCYGVMFCYPYAFIFSAMSVVLYEMALQEKNKTTRVWQYLGALLCIIISNFVYQVSATTAFFILSLFLLYDKKKKSLSHALYVPCYIIGTGIYYVISKVIEMGYGKSPMERGTFISSFKEILEKCIFFLDILRKSFLEVVHSFIPVVYGNREADFPVQTIVYIIILGAVLFIGYGLWHSFLKRKDIWGFFTMLCLLPLSYYPFLILNENGGVSYYRTSLCSIILLLIFNGIYLCEGKYSVKVKKLQRGGIFVVLLVAELLTANLHQRVDWIKDSNLSYSYILHELRENQKENRELNWCHIYGASFPGQVDVYTTKMVQYALEKLQVENRGNIKITFSSNKWYTATVSIDVFSEIEQFMTEDEIQFFKECYDYSVYGFYQIKPEVGADDEAKEKLHNLFVKTGIMPADSEEALCITLETY